MNRNNVTWVLLADGLFNSGIDLPSPWFLPAAVGVQVLFALGEAAYCLPSRTGGPNRRVA